MNTNFFGEQDYLDAILENLQDGIYITDAEANTVYINHAYERISGLIRSDMIGRNMRDLVSEGIISVSGTLSVLETGQSITTEQSFKTGKRAVITSSPVYADSKTTDYMIMVVTIVREITEVYSIRREMSRLIIQNRQYANEIERLNQMIDGDVPMVAVNADSVRLLRLAERVSMVDTPVLISGEKGVGKESLARYIHSQSKRRLFPFFRLDWSVIAREDPVRYLFGYVHSKTNDYTLGALENADGGTVFVDELTEMPSAVRDRFASLLRSGSCMMGDGDMRKLNIRFIFASRYTYNELAGESRIENEILKCLATFPIEMLPLRERHEDIVPLLDYFLSRYNQKTGENKAFSRACCKRLLAYAWPENVREVRIVVERAAIVSRGDVIEESDLLLNDKADSRTDREMEVAKHEIDTEFVIHEECNDLKYESARLEAYYMKLAFQKFGNIRDAAASLGIDSSTFVRKRQRYKQIGLMTDTD